MKFNIIIFSIVCYLLAFSSAPQLMPLTEKANEILVVFLFAGLPGLIMLTDAVISFLQNRFFKKSKPIRLDAIYTGLAFINVEKEPPEAGETVILAWLNDVGDIDKVMKGCFLRGQWQSQGKKLESAPDLWLPMPAAGHLL